MQDLVNDLIDKVDLEETTYSDAIAYLPGGFSSVQKVMRTLSKQKDKWKIQVLERGDKLIYDFEGVQRIIVDKKDRGDFLKKILKNAGSMIDPANFVMDMRYYLEEARDEEMAKARKDLEAAFASRLVQPDIRDLRDRVKAWRKLFGADKVETPRRVLLEASKESLAADIRNLIDMVERRYRNDLGTVQMIAAAIEEGRPLSTFDVFNGYDSLIGTVLTTNRPPAGPMTYESIMDLGGNVVESIRYKDPDLDEVFDNMAGIKQVGDVVYPTAGTFDLRFMNELLYELDSME